MDATILNEKFAFLGESKKLRKTRLSLAVIIYLGSVVSQILIANIANNQASNYLIICGVIAQIQVLVSLYLVVFHQTLGFYISAFLTVANILSLLLSISRGNYRSIPGLVSLLGTLLIITLTHVFWKKIRRRNEMLTEQKTYSI